MSKQTTADSRNEWISAVVSATISSCSSPMVPSGTVQIYLDGEFLGTAEIEFDLPSSRKGKSPEALAGE